MRICIAPHLSLCYPLRTNLLKTYTDFLNRIGQPFAAKDDNQDLRRALASEIILILTALLYWWLYL